MGKNTMLRNRDMHRYLMIKALFYDTSTFLRALRNEYSHLPHSLKRLSQSLRPISKEVAERGGPICQALLVSDHICHLTFPQQQHPPGTKIFPFDSNFEKQTLSFSQYSSFPQAFWNQKFHFKSQKITVQRNKQLFKLMIEKKMEIY